MDEALIANWNSVIKPTDEVWHLGDFSFHRSTWQPDAHLVERLNGKINFIVGNHDNEGFMRKCPFNSVHEGIVEKTFKVGDENYRFVLSHYPLREWNGFYRGVFHLYGHVHNSLAGHAKSMDVGVDTNNFYPWSLTEIVNKLSPIENKH